MLSRHITVTLPVSRAQVFNYLADIENLPRWSAGCCEWIELHRDGWWAYTALGELVVETKVDDIAGVIDLTLRHVAGWSIVMPLRVRSDGDGGALVHIACRQATGMAAENYEQLFESLLVGLSELSGRLRPELTVA